MGPYLRVLALLIAAATAGLASVLVPYIASSGYVAAFPAEHLPVLASAWEELQLTSLVLLAVAGGILGFLSPKHWLLVGPAAAMPFPIVAIMEMRADPTSHNLWPIEFVLYVVFIAGPALGGAAIGASIRRKTTRAT